MSLPTTYFDHMFAKSDDPWSFRTRWYEKRKRAMTLAVLPSRRYRRVFEPGCSIGELTVQLAERSDYVLATDCSPSAVAIARRRVAHCRNVELACARFPDRWPSTKFDLIVISELGYYYDLPTLASIARKIPDLLSPHGEVVLCHWRRPVDDYPLDGDSVHRVFGREMAMLRVSNLIEQDFLLEVWNADGQSVASREGFL